MLRLESEWRPGANGGVLALTLTNGSPVPLERFALALTSLFPLVTAETPLRGARFVEGVSSYQAIMPAGPAALAPGARWRVQATLGYELRHYTSAIKSAYLTLADGSTLPVETPPTSRAGETTPLRRASAAATAAERSGCGVFPHPRRAAMTGAQPLPAAFSLANASPEADAACRAVAALARRLFPSEPPPFVAAGGLRCEAIVEAAMPDEAYRIAFAPARVAVSAATRAGWFYAFLSLAQMLRAARLQAPAAFPDEGEIADAPRFAWRGMLLDVARQAFRPGDVLRLIDCLAWLKLNRLHLHLTDDEGWRIDVPRFPQLAERASRRGHGLPVPPLLGSAAEPYGLVYSPADCRTLNERAAELSLAIVPEIEMPGHSFSALQALPHLRDPDDCGPYRSILNPGLPATYDVVEAVIDETARLFPSQWLHVGADEVPDDAWARSPLACAFMAAHGLSDGPHLQAHFLRRVQRMVAAAGRVTGAWEEAALAEGLDPSDCYLVGWRNRASGAALAEQGYDIVLSPGDAYYLDMAQADAWWEPGMDWAGVVSAESCYAYEPAAGWPAGRERQLLGVQACLWGEHLYDRTLVNRLAAPRLFAVAESAWTMPERKDFRRLCSIADLLPLPATA